MAHSVIVEASPRKKDPSNSNGYPKNNKIWPAMSIGPTP
jgi:hypothetical protein